MRDRRLAYHFTSPFDERATHEITTTVRTANSNDNVKRACHCRLLKPHVWFRMLSGNRYVAASVDDVCLCHQHVPAP